MSRGFRLFKVLGIQISVDYTWFAIFVLFSWSLASGYFPSMYPGLGPARYFFMGVASSLLLFVCVLIHEISHSYTANRLGLDIHEITLFIFGGVAQLTKEPEDPYTELKIAIAGPAASAVLAIFFLAVSRLIPGDSFPVAKAITSYLTTINVVLLIFNMIPGFPLDGGRVFRALWWARTGDINGATRVASAIGKGFAVFLIALGLLQIFVGNFTGGLWSVLIGIFVQQAAESGYRQVLVKNALNGLKVSDLMSRDVVTINEEIDLADAVEKYFFKYHHSCFPVSSGGRVAGLLTLANIRGIERDLWGETLVRDIMTRIGKDETLSPTDSAIDAMTRLANTEAGRIVVMERGDLAGIISRRDIMKVLELKAEFRR
ncbi:MAG: site-2 protease family protein [Deltaproteobacteria bacterium]